MLSDEIWLQIKGEAVAVEDEIFWEGEGLSPPAPQDLSRRFHGEQGKENREIAFKASDSWLLTGGERRGCVSNYLCRWGQIPRGDEEP